MSTALDPPVVKTPLAAGVPFMFTADAFFRMIEAGVFHREDRVGLWEGRIYQKMAKNIPHSNTSMILPFTINRILPDGWFLMAENPVNLGPRLAPLPDYCVLRGVPKDYLGRHPVATDIGLLIELSDSSLKHDTSVKWTTYAEAGIPAYWVVNLVQNLIQTYETPVPAEGRYALEAVYAVGQSVPLRLDGILIAEIAALDLLPVRA